MAQDKPLSAIYHTKALESLDLILEEFSKLETQYPEIQQGLESLPAAVRKDRTFMEMLVDDVAENFRFITRNVEEEDVPVNFYVKLKNWLKQPGDDVHTEKELGEELKKNRLETSQKPIAEVNAMPTSVKLAMENVPLEEFPVPQKLWYQLLAQIETATANESILAARENVNTLTAEFQKAAHDVASAASLRHQRKELEKRKQQDAANSNQQVPGQEPESTNQQEPMDEITTAADIPGIVQKGLQKDQQVYLLKKSEEEHLKALDKIRAQLQELGEDADLEDIARLEVQIKETELSEAARKTLENEIDKLRHMSKMSPEHGKLKTYIETALDWPWGKYSDLNTDLEHTQEILDADHYGMEKVKESILQSVAIQGRVKDGKAPIICLVGPPGVGKTSICRSLAQATGRELVTMSLGGIRDVAEIRGHGYTYVGSGPGKIVKNISKGGTINPLFMLDEIDKARDGGISGDPTAALLEALDPEQNSKFRDSYLDMDMDLSKVMFVTTANDLSKIPPPLRDRMDVITLDGYVTEEKMEIAKRYLVPKKLKETDLDDTKIEIPDETLKAVIMSYTPEAGVRRLEKAIDKICGFHVKEIRLGNRKEEDKVVVKPEDLEEYLGPPVFTFKKKNGEPRVGIINGLAASDLGGSVLEIQAVNRPGDGKGFKIESTATGDMGGMMERSIKVAASYIQSNAEQMKIKEEDLKKINIHVHVNDAGGGVDGPSAGAALATTILSAAVAEIHKRKIRPDIAMTGTISLDGKVGKIGGLKQKLDAARNDPNISTVLIPEDNVPDLAVVPQAIKDALEIIPVSSVDEVFEHTFVGGFKKKDPANDQSPSAPHNSQRAPGSGGGPAPS